MSPRARPQPTVRLLWAAAVALAALAASGCSGPQHQGSGALRLGDGSTVDLRASPTEAGKGAIAGVVVDEAIRPIAGANVSLAGKVLASTDAQGVFVLDALEPGSVILGVSAPGHLPIQTSADVAAGQTTRVRVLLPTDTSPQPYHTTYAHDGYMQEWAGIGQFFVEETLQNGSGLCDCRVWFTPDPNATTMVYEAYWDAAVPDPADQGQYYWVVEEPTGKGLATGYCESPCVNDVPYDGSGFKSGTQAYARLDGPDEWVALQQKFQLFLTVWYHGEPPDGWTVAST